MRINQNISALNAWRNLEATDAAMSKSLERLSSGLRVNRAADDAAGLAISEKMRGQIKGLNQATRNAQDAISLIQTAEGALNETHSILQRMRELAVQSASDTNTTADRAQIQKEIDQLSQELSRIGNTTEFNTMPLLSGTFKGTFQIGANESQNISIAIADMRGFALGVAGKASIQQSATLNASNTIASGTYTVVSDGGTGYKLLDSAGVQVGKSADGLTWTDMATTPNTMAVFSDAVTSGTIVVDTVAKTATGVAYIDNKGLQAGEYTVDGSNNVLDSAGRKIGTFDTTAKVIKDLSGTTLTGTINTVLTNGKFTVGGVDVSTQTAANAAITVVQGALDNVSNQRSALGAVQNRLEHTIANLSTAAENLTAAESRIRDVDMAQEMSAFTRNQILLQAGTAMLAQANQKPQSVLQLLR